jgi:thymidylate synthase ThyX
MAAAFDPAHDIRVLREPTVYLLGRQVVDAAEFDRFLKDHGVAWQTDTEVAGEHLTEVAGRLCYMSFARPRPGGNQVYLNHILEVGHGSVLEHAVWNFVFAGVSRSLTHELIRHRAGFGYCLTGDTLVYSDHYCNGVREGIKKRSLQKLFEMTKTAHGRSRLKLLRLRCLDEAANTFTRGRVRTIVCSGKKPVFRVELEDGKAITCSREHRFLTPNGWQPLHRIVGEITVSGNGLTHVGSLEIPLATNGTPAYQCREWLEDQYLAKGLEQEDIAELAGVSVHTIRSWIRKHGLQKPLGSWAIGREPWNKGREYHAGWKHSEETRKKLSERKMGSQNPQWRGGITREAVRIRKPIEELSPRVYQRDDYRCRVCGKRGRKLTIHHIIPIWADPDLAHVIDNLATVCRLCHRKLNGRELDYVNYFGKEMLSIPALEEKRKKLHRGRLLIPRFRRIKSVTYAGEQITYDVEMEGPHHNFVANGIISHNSQLSQRYVDESVAEYVEPDEIAADPELHQIWLDAIAHSHQAYILLAAKLQERLQSEPDRTLRRKMARQAARSVLPNATETKIFVTANARALRHFIELRGSRHADVEIRKLAIKVLQLMQKEAPHIFNDYQLVPLPDGTFEAVTEHRKV